MAKNGGKATVRVLLEKQPGNHFLAVEMSGGGMIETENMIKLDVPAMEMREIDEVPEKEAARASLAQFFRPKAKRAKRRRR